MSSIKKPKANPAGTPGGVRGKLIPLRRLEGVPAEMSDEALVAACATGERAALGALFDRYHAAVHRFLASRAGTNDRDLDDLVQQTFMTINRCADSFDGRSAVRTWIFGVANNVSRHYVRSEIRRGRMLRSVGETAETAAPAAAEQSERRVALARAIAGLPDKLREAFVLVYVEGLSGVDAAAAIGCREGTLYKRLHQARKALRAVLEDVR